MIRINIKILKLTWVMNNCIYILACAFYLKIAEKIKIFLFRELGNKRMNKSNNKNKIIIQFTDYNYTT